MAGATAQHSVIDLVHHDLSKYALSTTIAWALGHGGGEYISGETNQEVATVKAVLHPSFLTFFLHSDCPL